jgi:hypothetical protein
MSSVSNDETKRLNLKFKEGLVNQTNPNFKFNHLKILFDKIKRFDKSSIPIISY